MNNTINFAKNNNQKTNVFIVSKEKSRFTENDLENHKKVFNPSTFPEYFNYNHLGLDYLETILINKDVLNRVAKSGFQQFYRKGINKKYDEIRKDVNEKGIDIRKKMHFIALDDNGNYIDIFSGNTFANVLNTTKLENRIVSVFKTNKNYNVANLITVGVHQNSLEKPHGEATDQDIRYALKQIYDTGSLGVLKPNASIEERELFADKAIGFIEDMTGKSKRQIMEKKEYSSAINDLVNSQLNENAVYSAKNGAKLMEDLISLDSRYRNSKNVYYTSYSNSFAAKVYQSMRGDFQRFADNNINSRTSPDYFDYEGGSYCVIIHGGEPDPTDPVKWFFKKNKEFLDNWNSNNRFSTDHFFESDSPIRINKNIKMIGVIQQVRDLDHLFPFMSVITWEDFLNAYNNYYLKRNATTANTVYGHFSDLDDEKNEE